MRRSRCGMVVAVVAAGVTLKVVFGVEGGREGRTDGSDIPVFARATAAASFFTLLARADLGHVLSPIVHARSCVDHLTFFASGPEIILVGTRMAALYRRRSASSIVREFFQKVRHAYQYCSLYVELLFSFLLRPTLCRTVATVAWPMSPSIL